MGGQGLSTAVCQYRDTKPSFGVSQQVGPNRNWLPMRSYREEKELRMSAGEDRQGELGCIFGKQRPCEIKGDIFGPFFFVLY